MYGFDAVAPLQSFGNLLDTVTCGVKQHNLHIRAERRQMMLKIFDAAIQKRDLIASRTGRRIDGKLLWFKVRLRFGLRLRCFRNDLLFSAFNSSSIEHDTLLQRHISQLFLRHLHKSPA
ncbi:MAG: hypothetical protein OXR62_03605 [Ahrensia sp.]|nr:hypothetical protein [Ahrensia sp.]